VTEASSISVIISIVSLIISVLVAFFFMGTRWAKMNADLKNIMWRLERIEKLFKLRLDNDDR
jgi:hypothetical protein